MRSRELGFSPTRRGALWMIAGVSGYARLYAAGSDFWNRKDPSEWSGEEINLLTSKSPWAKAVSATYTPSGGDGGGGQAGGMGGGRAGGHPDRNGPGLPGQIFKGTIRWESAKPVMEALKAPLAAAFANHYVISVTGFPVELSARRPRSQSEDSNLSMQDLLDHLKGVTLLQAKDQRDVQPGIVQQPPSGSYGTTILFGFSKEFLTLTSEDKEVTFVTEFGRLGLKAKFILKDMLYRGELAL